MNGMGPGVRLAALPGSWRARRRAAALAVLAAALAGWLAAERRPVVTETVEEIAIPAPVRVRRSELLGRGWTVILRRGRPGAYLALVRRTRRGGRETARSVIESRLLRAPRAEERLAGTSGRPNKVNAPSVTRAVRTHRLLATGYDPGPLDNGWDNAGRTKLGWRTRQGVVAVDPAVIPLRSLLYVEGYGLAWAGDVGGAIKGDRIDLCFNRTEDALAWGRRRTAVHVLEGVSP